MTAQQPRTSYLTQIAFGVVIVAAFASFFIFHLDRFLSLEFLQAQKEAANNFYEDSPLLMISGFMGVYLLFTLLALPGISVLMIAGGAIFDLEAGTVIVALSSGLSATASFLTSRYFLRSIIENKWAQRMKTIDREMEKDGLLFLFTLRLIPVMPYSLVNISMGLTRISALSFFLVTLAGMSITSFIYVNAGTHLAALTKMSDIWSPGLIGSFVALALTPIASRFLIAQIRKARAKRS